MTPLACPEAPGLPGHVVEVVPTAGGYAVRCIPHGDLGEHETHLAAFTAACIHDDDVAPWGAKGWLGGPPRKEGGT